MKMLLQNAIFHILMDSCLSVFVLLQLITDISFKLKNCNWGIDLTMLVTHQFLNPIFEGGWSKLKVEFEVTKVGTSTELVVDAGFRIRFRITSFRDQGWWMFDCMKWSASELEIQSFFPRVNTVRIEMGMRVSWFEISCCSFATSCNLGALPPSLTKSCLR